MTDFGTDFSCTDDFTPDLALSSGRLCVAQAIARRLITPRGGLIGDPNYGYDLTQFINDDLSTPDLARIVAGIVAECNKDERVDAASASLVVTHAGVLVVTITLEDSVGPFALVLSVTASNISILAGAA